MKSLMRLQLGQNGDVPDLFLVGKVASSIQKTFSGPSPTPLHADSLESAAEKQSVDLIVHMCKCGI